MSRRIPFACTLAALAYSVAGLAGCTDPVAPGPIVGTTVVIDNQLVAPIDVTINGIDVGRVGARQKRTIQRGELDYVEVAWRAEQPLVEGAKLGDSVGARFQYDVPDGETELTFEVDNVIFDGARNVTLFAPMIGNATSGPIVVGLNMDTPREHRLGILQPGSPARFIGYYALDPGTSVRAYRPEVAYGPMLYIEKAFGHAFTNGDLESGSGALPILFESDPP